MAWRLTRPRPAPAGQRTADGVPGPDAIAVSARHVEVSGWHAATLAVTGYPAEVSPGWLEPLTSYPGRLDVALHIEPVPPRGGRRAAAQAAGPAGIGPPRRTPARAAWMTPAPKPPPRTRGSWPTGWPAGRAACSAPACT